MNLYDAYLTSCDRASCREELAEVFGAPRGEEKGRGAGTCPRTEACPLFPSLAMVYAPHQAFRHVYDHNEALSRGTLFRELDKPLGVGGRR